MEIGLWQSTVGHLDIFRTRAKYPGCVQSSSSLQISF